MASELPTHPRRVLLTVCGLSPQIITETLYAMHLQSLLSGRADVPTEIHALTTSEGADRIYRVLLQPGPDGRLGGFAQLCADHSLPPIEFDAGNVHVVHRVNGQPLSDIRSADDNALMADAITALVQRFTADPACALHVSLAGGRKTMGYYAGYALSLLGREQDRLSHVLVNTPFEAIPSFLYPTPHSEVLTLHDGSTADASKAEVSLAQVPFVRLRSLLPQAMLQGPMDFVSLVHAVESRVEQPRLVLDIASQSVHADGQTIPMTPWHFALMALLAYRCQRGLPPLTAPLRDAHDAPWAEEVLPQLRQALGVMHVPDRVQQQLCRDATGNKLAPHWSRLRSALDAHLGEGRRLLYFSDGGTHKHKRYHIPLPPDAVEIRRVPAASLQNPLRT